MGTGASLSPSGPQFPHLLSWPVGAGASISKGFGSHQGLGPPHHACLQLLGPISAPASPTTHLSQCILVPSIGDLLLSQEQPWPRRVSTELSIAGPQAALSTATAQHTETPKSSASPPGTGRDTTAGRGQMQYTGAGRQVSPAHISSRILSMSGRRHNLFRNRSKISKENSSGRMDSL